MSIVMNRETLLLFRAMAAFRQFDDQRVFIKLFIQAGPERGVYFHRRGENIATQFFMNEATHFQQSVLIRAIRGFI
jgi:hypothetical protein